MRTIRTMLRVLVMLCGAAALPAHATLLHFAAVMNGANESPPVTTAATGFVTVDVDTLLNQLTVGLTFSGLIGGPAAAGHIHCCTASPGNGNAAIAVPFTNFPNLTSASYNQTFDLTLAATYTSAFLNSAGGTAALAEQTLIAGLIAGDAYANVHDAIFPGGEIRALLPRAVPEPAPVALLALAGLAALAIRRRRR